MFRLKFFSFLVGVIAVLFLTLIVYGWFAYLRILNEKENVTKINHKLRNEILIYKDSLRTCESEAVEINFTLNEYKAKKIKQNVRK